jgi:tRNA(adenine34) deaminase
MRKIYFIYMAFCLAITSIAHANNSTDLQEKKDIHYMQIALEDAKGNPKAAFAALIVDNTTGEILCKGLNAAKHNPTWHGEIVAINNSKKFLLR